MVRINEPFLTDDMDVEINLEKGMTGKVMLLDGDGNPQVHFGGLKGVQSPKRWVSKANFSRMSVKKRENYLSFQPDSRQRTDNQVSSPRRQRSPGPKLREAFDDMEAGNGDMRSSPRARLLGSRIY